MKLAEPNTSYDFILLSVPGGKIGVTEQLKADNQIVWTAQMNNIRNRAAEIADTKLIYTWSV